jgi:hypothetical protein
MQQGGAVNRPGSGPAYGVSTAANHRRRSLVSSLDCDTNQSWICLLVSSFSFASLQHVDLTLTLSGQSSRNPTIQTISSIAKMADAVDVEPEFTDNRKARAQDPTDDDVKDVEEKLTEPTNFNGSKVEKIETVKIEEEKPKPSRIKELWGKIGLDVGTLLMMFKWVSSIQNYPRMMLILQLGVLSRQRLQLPGTKAAMSQTHTQL